MGWCPGGGAPKARSRRGTAPRTRVCFLQWGREGKHADVEYRKGFKARMVQRMTGPDAMSARELAMEVGVSQSTLSRWRRQAATIVDMNKDNDADQHKPPPEQRSAEEKLRIVMEAARLPDEELGAFLRREGVHESHLETWRREMLEALNGSSAAPRRPRKAAGEAKRIKALERELRRKDKALAEAAALLVLQKKVQALWGDEGDDTNGSSGV